MIAGVLGKRFFGCAASPLADPAQMFLEIPRLCELSLLWEHRRVLGAAVRFSAGGGEPILFVSLEIPSLSPGTFFRGVL